MLVQWLGPLLPSLLCQLPLHFTLKSPILILLSNFSFSLKLSYPFTPRTPMYTGVIHVSKLLFVFLILICLLLQRGLCQEPECKQKIIVSPLYLLMCCSEFIIVRCWAASNRSASPVFAQLQDQRKSLKSASETQWFNGWRKLA